MRKKPELLAPAGDLEKLKTAITFGADAVYAAGRRFGLRAKAANLRLPELAEGIRFAHDRNRKVYVAANIFARDADLADMPDYFRALREISADALIISDPGVFALARAVVPEIPIHISTQAGNTNAASALFWHEQGACRVVLARELSWDDISRLTEKLPSGLETEAFVHGSMCVSYSGRCLLSAALTGRDANQGLCAHPCRYKYALVEESRPGEYFPLREDDTGSYLLNSKDLCLIGEMPRLFSSGLASLKIEGRMKSAYYVAAVTAAYRRAIDDFFADPALYESQRESYVTAVKKAGGRSFSTAFFTGEDAMDQTSTTPQRPYDFLALITDYDPVTATAQLRARNKFSEGERAEILRSHGAPPLTLTLSGMTDPDGRPITSAPHPGQPVFLKTPGPVRPFDMLIRPRD